MGFVKPHAPFFNDVIQEIANPWYGQYFQDSNGQVSDPNLWYLDDSSKIASQRRKVNSARVYNFDGVDDYVSFSNNTFIPTNRYFTLCANWVKGSSRSVFFWFSNLAFQTDLDFKPRILFANNSINDINQRMDFVYPLADSGRFIVIIDREDLFQSKLYKDGILVNVESVISGSNFISYVENFTIFSIGRIGGTYGDGKQSNLQIWNIALSEADILHDYQDPVGFIKSKQKQYGANLKNYLKLHLKCDESDGTQSFDSSGNGNHGTITNATLSTFHATDNSGLIKSWQNEVGYSNDGVMFESTLGVVLGVDTFGSGSDRVKIFIDGGKEYKNLIRYRITFRSSTSCGFAQGRFLNGSGIAVNYFFNQAIAANVIYTFEISVNYTIIENSIDFLALSTGALTIDYLKVEEITLIPRNESSPKLDVLGNKLTYNLPARKPMQIVGQSVGNFTNTSQYLQFTTNTNWSTLEYQTDNGAVLNLDIANSRVTCSTIGRFWDVVIKDGGGNIVDRLPVSEGAGTIAHNIVRSNNSTFTNVTNPNQWSTSNVASPTNLLEGSYEFRGLSRQGSRVDLSQTINLGANFTIGIRLLWTEIDANTAQLYALTGSGDRRVFLRGNGQVKLDSTYYSVDFGGYAQVNRISNVVITKNGGELKAWYINYNNNEITRVVTVAVPSASTFEFNRINAGSGSRDLIGVYYNVSCFNVGMTDQQALELFNNQNATEHSLANNLVFYTENKQNYENQIGNITTSLIGISTVRSPIDRGGDYEYVRTKGFNHHRSLNPSEIKLKPNPFNAPELIAAKNWTNTTELGYADVVESNPLFVDTSKPDRKSKVLVYDEVQLADKRLVIDNYEKINNVWAFRSYGDARVSLGQRSDLRISTSSQFIISGWFSRNRTTSAEPLFSNDQTLNGSLGNTGIYLNFFLGNLNFGIRGNQNIAIDSSNFTSGVPFYAVCVWRGRGNDMSVFVNGVEFVSVTTFSQANYDGGGYLLIGDGDTQASLNNYFSKVNFAPFTADNLNLALAGKRMKNDYLYLPFSEGKGDKVVELVSKQEYPIIGSQLFQWAKI